MSSNSLKNNLVFTPSSGMQVTVYDNAGISIASPLMSLTEGGTTDSYHVSLDSEIMHMHFPGSTSTYAVQSDADAYVAEETPSTVTGLQDALRVNGATGARMTSYLRFPLSSMSSTRVGSAVLRLYKLSGGDNPGVGGSSVYW